MKPISWFGIIALFIAVTILTVVFVPGDSPLFVFRFVFGFVFVLFLPGYLLVEILFRGENRLDSVEKAVLSVALSFGVTGIVGLFLGLSPVGMASTLTVSVIVITLGLAVVAFVRKMMEARKPQVQNAEAKASSEK